MKIIQQPEPSGATAKYQNIKPVRCGHISMLWQVEVGVKPLPR